MKKIANILTILGLVLGSTLAGAVIVNASICPVAQGCTGVGTLTGIIQGSGTSPFTATALPADATKYLDGTGAFSTPAGGGTPSIGGGITGGTDNSALFVHGAGIIAQDNTNYIYTTANGLRIGPTSAAITSENKLSVIGNANDYHGIFVQNVNSGTLASTDIVCSNDLGVSDVTTYCDFGANSSGNTNPAMTGFKASDVYLFTSGQLKAINIATGSAQPIRLFYNGYLTANEVAETTSTGLNVGLTGTTTGAITFQGATSTGIKLQGQAVGSSGVLTLPAATDTLVGKATTDTLTNKTISGSSNTLTNIGNSSLTNSTISGVALGATLATLTATNGTLTFSGSYTGTGAQTVGLNLANANTWTAAQTISTAPFIISGNQSATAWTTQGQQFATVAASLTDSTSSGTVGTHAANSIGIPTFLASSASTYTNAVTLYIAGAPVASTNVTDTNSYAMYINAGTSFFNGGVVVNSGSLGTGASSASANFLSLGGSISSTTTSALSLFAGATTINYRTIMNGSTSTSIGINNSYTNLVVGSSPLTLPASGTAALLANLVVNPIGTVTNGSAIAVTNTATEYINGAGSGGTTNYSLWDVGQSRFDLGSDATGDTFYRASTGVFTRLAIGATGTHLVVSGGIPSWTAQTGVSNYTHTIFTPTTGQTIMLINNQYNIVNPAGALLALTVNLPSSPANNDVVYIKFTQNVTTVTYANGTVVDGITAPTAGGLTVLTYDSGTTSWY